MQKRFLRGMLYRDGKLFWRAMCRALVLTLLFALLCGAVAYGLYASVGEGETPFTIAVVDEDDSIFSRVALRVISEDETLSGILSLVMTDEATAREGVQIHRFAGAVILPAGYFHDINYGKQTYATVLFSHEALHTTELVEGLARFGERLIKTGQYAVFAPEDVLVRQPGHSAYYQEFILAINDVVLSEISGAGTSYFTEVPTAYAHSALPLLPHTLLIFVLFLIEICTLFFYKSTTADLSGALYLRLLACGGTVVGFLLPKILYSFCYRLALGLLLFSLCGVWMPLVLTPLSVGAVLLAIFLFAATGTLFSVALAGSRYGIAALSSVYILFLFLGGGLLPLSLLSESVAAVGKKTLLGACYSLAALLFGASLDGTAFLVAGGWLLFALGAAMLGIRRVKRKEETDR